MENDFLFNVAKTGIELESFLSSSIGKAFTKRCDDMERVAELAMRTVDPEDAKAVRELQNRLLVVDEFRRFVIEGIQEGKAAAEQLDEEARI